MWMRCRWGRRSFVRRGWKRLCWRSRCRVGGGGWWRVLGGGGWGEGGGGGWRVGGGGLGEGMGGRQWRWMLILYKSKNEGVERAEMGGNGRQPMGDGSPTVWLKSTVSG